MANKIFVGTAPKVAQESRATPANVAINDVFTLTINGKSVSFTATAATVANVTAGLTTAWNALSSTEYPEFAEVTASDQTTYVKLLADKAGESFTVTATSTGGGAVNEVQSVSISGSPTGGTFTLTFDGQVTAGIAFNAMAAAVVSALEALSNIGVGDVAGTGGPLPGTAVTITFQGALAATNVSQMTANSSGLTGGTTPTASVSTTTQGAPADSLTISTPIVNNGPEDWSSTENWSPSGVPVNNDDVTLDRNAKILHGLAQSTVTLTSLTFEASFFPGEVGLPLRNPRGYNEYRTTELTIGATTVNIRGGGGRIKLNLGTAQTTVNIDDTGQTAEQNVPTIQVRGTNAANVLNVEKGNVGSALTLGHAATWATVRISYKNNIEGDANIRLGAGCTLTTIDKHGGTLEINSSVTTLTNNAGICHVEAGTPGQINCRGGTVFYNTSGTLGGNTVVSGSGHLDFSRDARPKTVTNPIEVHGDKAKVSDPYKVVTSLVLDINEEANSNNFNIGRNIRLTRGAVA